VETLGRILPGTGCRPITMVPKPKFTLTKKINSFFNYITKSYSKGRNKMVTLAIVTAYLSV
jgi:hypothetical protein